MTGSTYNCDTWAEVQQSATTPMSLGSAGPAASNTDTNFDLQVADDMFLRTLELITQNATMGDRVTVQVIDTNGVTGAPPGTVVAQPVLNWNVIPGTNDINYESVTPRKILGTMTIRAIYHNSSLILNTVNIGINYNFLKILF